jgi:hypothetical protein
LKQEDCTQQKESSFRLCWGLAAILFSAALASEPQITGRYALQSANGKDLPAVVAENKETRYQLEVTRGWMELRVNRTFVWRTAYQITENGAVRTTESGGNGSYDVSGNVLSLKPEGSSSAVEGHISNNTLVVQADVKLVYRKADASN